MTDLFVLLQLPDAGDDLQAIKKGVMELADLVAINKADLDPTAATRAQAQLSSALRFFGPQASHGAQVVQVSALTGQGLPEFWAEIERLVLERRGSGAFHARRKAQEQAWLWERVHAGLQQRFRDHPAVKTALPGLLAELREGTLPASVAARRLLDLFGH
jgi:LAO/AO transport system kinase